MTRSRMGPAITTGRLAVLIACSISAVMSRKRQTIARPNRLYWFTSASTIAPTKASRLDATTRSIWRHDRERQHPSAQLGGGVDSSAVLTYHLLEHDLGIDQVVFADTGAESSATYRNVERFKALGEQAGIPFTIVRKAVRRSLSGSHG